MKFPKVELALRIVGVAGVAIAAPLAAQTADTNMVSVKTATGRLSVVEATHGTSKIVGLNRADRTIELLMDDGKRVELVAGPQVRNFDKLKVGDIVHAKYTAAVSIGIKKAGTASRGQTESTQLVRVSGTTGAILTKRVTEIVDVAAIDAKTQMVTLHRKKGHDIPLYVADKTVLKRLKVGDYVEAVYEEAAALTVQPGG